MNAIELKYSLLQAISQNRISCTALTVYGKLKRLGLLLIPGRIITIRLKDLKCMPAGFSELIPIHKTPHFHGIYRDGLYLDYLKSQGIKAGYPAHNSEKRYNKLCNRINKDTYLKGIYKRGHIIVFNKNGNYLILDGLHRGAILAFKGIINVDVKLVNNFWYNAIRNITGCYK